jgi:CheY-like chemotaxis protein
MTLPPLQILIIDDDPLVGQALRRNLAGHQVTLAESGARALDELAADAPPAFDVILCDVMMPGKSGIDVYRDVQARFPERCGTFIFTTGGAYQAEAVKFLQEVDAPCLEKPFTREELFRTIEGLVASKG